MGVHAHGFIPAHNDGTFGPAGNGAVDPCILHGGDDVCHVRYVQKGLRFGKIGQQDVNIARKQVQKIRLVAFNAKSIRQ